MGNLIRWAVLVGLAVVAAVVGGVFGWLLIGAFLCGVRCGMRYEWADARGLGIVAPESRISVAAWPALIVLGAGLWLSGGWVPGAVSDRVRVRLEGRAEHRTRPTVSGERVGGEAAVVVADRVMVAQAGEVKAMTGRNLTICGGVAGVAASLPERFGALSARYPADSGRGWRGGAGAWPAGIAG